MRERETLRIYESSGQKQEKSKKQKQNAKTWSDHLRLIALPCPDPAGKETAAKEEAANTKTLAQANAPTTHCAARGCLSSAATITTPIQPGDLG